MDKKKKIIFIILIVILIILCVIGVLSFISYSSYKPQKNQDFGNTEIDPENSNVVKDVMVSNSDEFIEYIKSYYYTAESEVKLDSDVDGCYKATGPDGVRYSYCDGAADVSIEG